MRIQLEISESRREQIRELMEKADFKTYSDLFNNAITLLQWSVRQIEDGCLIVSLNPETERQKELAMPLLQHIAGDRNVAMVAVRKSTRKLCVLSVSVHDMG